MEQELAQLEQEVSDAPGAQVVGQAGIIKLRALQHGEESAANAPSEPLPIPVAPEGVEGVAAADEPTIMTERTADLLGVLDEDLAEQAPGAPSEPLPIPVAPEGVEGVAETDEATQVFARDEEEEDAPAKSTEASASAPASPSVEVSSDYEEEVQDERAEEQEGGGREEEGDATKAPRLGRHDLPEELFLTNELSRSELISPLEPLRDDLRNAEGSPDDDEETEAWEVTQQIESPLERKGGASEEELPLPTEGLDGVSLALSEAAESDIHSEWESMMQLDELRETDEFNVEEHLRADREPAKSLATASSPNEETLDLAPNHAMGLEDTADFNTSEIFASPTAAPPSVVGDEGASAERGEGEDAFEIEEIEGESTTSTQDAAATTEDDAAVAEEHEADGDGDEGDEERSIQSTEPLFQEAADFVSEGYAMALPFEIRPSEDDLRHGLKRSTATEEEKDLTFPRPQPKKLKQLVTRRYGYGDPPSERAMAARAATKAATPGAATASKLSTSASRPASSEPPRDYSRIVAIFALLLIVLVIATLIIISK